MRPGEGSFITAVVFALVALWAVTVALWLSVLPFLLFCLFGLLANEAANEALEDADRDG